MNIDWGFALAVMFVGLVVVFVVLIALVILCSLIGLAFEKGKKNKNNTDTKPKADSMPKKPVPSAAPKIEKGVSNEVVAAISAAVAMMTGGGAVVKSIKRTNGVKGTRPAWSNAGVIENTRPF